MTGYPRDNVKGRGFWDGGTKGHSLNSQSSGRVSGLPGRRTQGRVGIKTDIEFPAAETVNNKDER